MGDRGSVYVVEPYHPERGVYLYTHWGCSTLPAAVQDALVQAQEQWGGYRTNLAHFIYQAMVDREQSGCDINSVCQDAPNYVLVVDPQHQLVGRGHGVDRSPTAAPDSLDPRWTFDEFLKLDPGKVWRLR